IDSFKAVFDSDNEEINKYILTPVAFDDIANANKELVTNTSRPYLGSYNSLYQRDSYFSNLGGKEGVSISASVNMQHALAQEMNLYFKSRSIMITDKNGILYNDYDENNKNSVNDVSNDTYSYISEEQIVDTTKENKGVWRFDKIIGLDGKSLISDL